MKYFTNTFRRLLACALFAAACALTLGLTLAFAQRPQWAHDQQHSGAVNVAGQNLNRVLADIVYDPFVEQEKAPDNGDGDLLVHYQTPLVDGNDIYMEFKTGTYTSITTWGDANLEREEAQLGQQSTGRTVELPERLEARALR